MPSAARILTPPLDKTPTSYRDGLARRIAVTCGDRCYREVGELTSTNYETARRYVQGLTRPDPAFLASLCEVFGVEPLWLLCGRGPMFDPPDHAAALARSDPTAEPRAARHRRPNRADSTPMAPR